VVVLKDQCPHRAALLAGEKVTVSLSLSWMEIYGCIDIPANAPETPILKSSVETYPVQGIGFVCCFMETLPEAERPPLPPFQNLKTRT